MYLNRWCPECKRYLKVGPNVKCCPHHKDVSFKKEKIKNDLITDDDTALYIKSAAGYGWVRIATGTFENKRERFAPVDILEQRFCYESSVDGSPIQSGKFVFYEISKKSLYPLIKYLLEIYNDLEKVEEDNEDEVVVEDNRVVVSKTPLEKYLENFDQRITQSQRVRAWNQKR